MNYKLARSPSEVAFKEVSNESGGFGAIKLTIFGVSTGTLPTVNVKFRTRSDHLWLVD